MNEPSINEIAKQILTGGTLSDKLTGMDLSLDSIHWKGEAKLSLFELEIPKRSGKLKPQDLATSVKMPSFTQLKQDSERGKLLHFFANHELLALETMAWALLQFPNAPEEFRKSLFRTIQEEQRHMVLYVKRMQELGVTLGDFPLNLYFWNTLKTSQSPMDFVVRMSLTFEQANLDFAEEQIQLMNEVGDATTAGILQQVHDDEIQHVKNGLKWFRVWANEFAEKSGQVFSEWELYQRLLPYPITARRARGHFFAQEAREKAGLSSDFIEEVKIVGGSRGRIPQLFIYNPETEIELAGGTWSLALKEKIQDLEPLLLWLGLESDVVKLSQTPPLQWRQEVFQVKGEIPAFMTHTTELEKIQHWDRLCPWGWSKQTDELSTLLKGKLRNVSELSLEVRKQIYSKTWWNREFPLLNGESFSREVGTVEEAQAWVLKLPNIETWIVKSEFSTSGRGHFLLRKEFIEKDLERFENQKNVNRWSMEPWLNRKYDFSFQYEINGDEFKPFPPRFFKVSPKFQYEGAFLGQRVRPEVPAEAWKALEEAKEEIKLEHHRVLKALRDLGYTGPVGIDGLLYEKNGKLIVHPRVEVNPRMTMGRLALELERVLKSRGKTATGVWHWVNQRDISISFADLEIDLKSKYPQKVISTTPVTSKSTWTYILLD